jgi:hypothetical protein
LCMVCGYADINICTWFTLLLEKGAATSAALTPMRARYSWRNGLASMSRRLTITPFSPMSVRLRLLEDRCLDGKWMCVCVKE